MTEPEKPCDEYMYEDDLPNDISDELYSWWFDNSFVNGVRIGPKIKGATMKEPTIFEQMLAGFLDQEDTTYCEGTIAALREVIARQKERDGNIQKNLH